MKPVRLSGHARDQLGARGVTEGEVVQAIREQTWWPADRGRLQWRKDVAFGREWNGTVYAARQVRPIFVDEANEIVVVTVYAYYF